MNYIEVPPRPKMAESLRNMGYAAVAAIADLIDNCIDADATNVKVLVSGEKTQKDPVSQIDIFDNGYGMSGRGIEEALTLGVESDKSNFDLGRFGMGLKTAGTSLGRRITVISKQPKNALQCRVYDLDTNEQQQKYVVLSRAATADEKKIFETEISADSGTWVSITKIDQEEYSSVNNMLKALKSERQLRTIFRRFLGAGTCSIAVNNCNLKPYGYDYIEGCRTIADWFPFILKDGTSLGNLKIISMIDANKKDQMGGGNRPQGVVVLRNNRDITPRPQWHGAWKHHWELAGVYVLWEANAAQFDPLMKTTVMKNSWTLSQSIRDALTREIAPDLKAYKKSREAERKSAALSVSTDVADVAKTYSNNLNNNMNLTPKPKVHNERHIPATERKAPGVPTETEQKKPKTRKPFTYASGQDEWIIKIDPGCGNGRYFIVDCERKQRGGRRFTLSVDTDHPWAAKYFTHGHALNERSMFAIYDLMIGDAYMELEQADELVADLLIRSKSDFLRARAHVITAHDAEPVELAAK